MTHNHVGLEAVLGQQPPHGFVGGEHSRLGDGRLHQVHLRLHHRALVLRVDKDVAGQRAAEDGRHDLVGLCERLGHDLLAGGEFAAHVHVLAALARKEEGQLAWLGAAAPEDALGLKSLPGRRVVEAGRLARLLDAVQQFGVVAKVNHQALRRADGFGVRRGD